MAEQPRNAAAGEKQRQYKKTEVKSIADQFEQAGLTRKNIDYMIQLNKQLDLQGADPDAKATMLEQTVMKLTESQKQGTTARTLLGTPTEYADQLIHPAPSAKQVERSASGLLAIDNALMFFAIFTVMFGIMGLSQPKSLASSNGNAGIVSILIVSIVGGLLFGYMTRLLTSTKDPKTGKRTGYPLWLRALLVVVAFVVWVAIYGLSAFIPKTINPVLNGWVYIVLAVVAFFGDMYFRRRYNVVGGFMGRPANQGQNQRK
ncbi:hypothetical protein PS3_21944 [Limosilactobacillus gastricus PS3]|uniref:Integral membrane protein n=1 Tax=Limosilactobacillus gastricus PS3 TaxID=1144300 RepID=H4GJN5_9LACO|nr:DUF1129 family protein [Limosilactobacillus gastricus]EHS86236.1 hypothetical protein PS3_21944 [Limosilactobacillus gastricus PS3]